MYRESESDLTGNLLAAPSKSPVQLTMGRVTLRRDVIAADPTRQADLAQLVSQIAECARVELLNQSSGSFKIESL